MTIREDTYCITNKYTGREHGLLLIRSPIGGEGLAASEIQVLTLPDRALTAGDYSLEFVKSDLADPITRRAAAMRAANNY